MADFDDKPTGAKGVCFDPKQAAAVLANDLNQMTAEERNIVLDDVHGVRKLSKEEILPSNLLGSLEQMDTAIEAIQYKKKSAYYKAVSLGSRYVLRDNISLRVRFLRADEFDSKKAAQRFVNYLDFYYELFGTIALVRPICFDDLQKEEQNILREGSIQLLPCRDRTGRRILTRMGAMGGPNKSQYHSTVMRVNAYMMQILATDEKTQQYGCVMVFHTVSFSSSEHDGNSEYDSEMGFLKETNIGAKIGRFVSAFPLRVGAVHFCFPRTLKYQLAAAALSIIAPSIVRVRVRTHIGSQTECLYALMSYGIPGDQLPVTSGGRIKIVNHHRWVKFQIEKENTIRTGLPSFEGVDCPSGMDILIGSNTAYYKNTPGNLLYQGLLNKHLQAYEEATDAQEKTRLTWIVLEELTMEGARILVRDRRGWWSVTSNGKAREKISNDFRQTRQKLAAAVVAYINDEQQEQDCE